MRALLLLALLAAPALEHGGAAQRKQRTADRYTRTRVRHAAGAGGDLFAVLPGGPTAGQMATGVLTGSKGEATTTQRATGMLCQGSTQLNAIVNDQPCVEPLGLLAQKGHTNLTANGTAFDNSSTWAPYSGGVAAPTVTANAAAAPDGTTTAERIDLPAVDVTAGNFSALINGGFSTSNVSWSVYAKGVSSGGTFYVFFQEFTSDTFTSAPCTYTTSAWTRCVVSVSTPNGGGYVHLGVRNVAAMASQGAQSFYAWGGDVEDSPYPHSIVTAQAGTSADNVNVVDTAVPGAGGSLSVDFTPLWNAANAPSVGAIFDSRNAGTDSGLLAYVLGADASKLVFRVSSSGTVQTFQVSGITWTRGTTYHLGFTWGAAGISAILNGTVVGTGPAQVATGYSSVMYLGCDNTGGNQLDGYVSNLRVNR
jgi:hypothetical protein